MYNKDTKKHEGFIYTITNIESGKKYVGQTIQPLSHRWGHHKCARNRAYVDSYIDNAIAKQGEEKFKIDLIETISADTKDELKILIDNAEIFYINKFETMVYQGGYNVSSGGQGYGLNRNNYSSKSIDCYDLYSKEYLKTFDSITDAGEYYNCDKSLIVKVCKGKKVHGNGIIFRYHGEDLYKYNVEIPVYNFTKLKKKVKVIDRLNSNKVLIFDSIVEASEALKCSSASLSYRLSNKVKKLLFDRYEICPA